MTILTSLPAHRFLSFRYSRLDDIQVAAIGFMVNKMIHSGL